MSVLITGATGLLGSKIAKACIRKDIAVKYLTTSKSKIQSEPLYQGYYWNPETGEIDLSCFDDVEVIIHLAGATVSKRWTTSYKKTILDSRVVTTRLLHKSLKSLNTHKVAHFISASGINIYPDSLIKYYEESETTIDSSFLGKVVKAWEDEVDTFFSLNIPVAKIRIGLVLAEEGGALPELKKPIDFGLGAVFGSGEQWQSWIHVDDVVRVFMHVLKYRLEGIYNAVAPNPVTHAELTRMVAKTLSKPLLLPNMPKSVMKVVLGDMHELLFASQRVGSKKIENKGFDFKFHNLQNALDDLLLQ
ncbi:TIGR01777 family oxidoreductase [Formosa sp. A9]|uniref:TIGR01777 family oxidoreductase n=1 Tax=Formosa sp. A9 TaxID=3442641 RepID=UPI003EC110CF